MRPFWPALVLGTVLVAGCSSDTGPAAAPEPSSSAPELGADLEVVAAVYPLGWIAREIAPDAEVELLNEGGQEAHDLDLSPVQRAGLETADVVLYVGDLDYQPQVEAAVGAAEGEVVDASAAAGEAALLLASEAGDAHGPRTSPRRDEQAEEGPRRALAERLAAPSPSGSPAEQSDEEQDGADEGAERIDPHLWFSPSIMARVAVATGRPSPRRTPTTPTPTRPVRPGYGTT
jgi:zinc transport system substrate-binding protein